MNLEMINMHQLRMPLIAPFETSFGRSSYRDCILIEIVSDGVKGYGECVADRDPGYGYETSGTAWHILSEFIIPTVFSGKINGPQDFHDNVTDIKGHEMAKAGMEMAFWDLIGKMEGTSLKDMLGGEFPKVKVGVSVGIQESPSSLVATVAEYLEHGYKRIKIKIKPGRDAVDTGLVRKEFPKIMLQVDANSAYTLETAEALLPLDTMDLLMIEQPLYADDLWDHSILQKSFSTPICLDESIISPRHARQALEMQACRIVNIKQGRVGGIISSKAIHDLCLKLNVPVWCGGMLETGFGRAANLALASLSNFQLPGDISATDRYYTRDITNERFHLNSDSTVTVPNTPGLGVTVDEEAVKAYTIRSGSFNP